MSMFYELMMRKKEEIMYATIKGTLTENDGVFSGFSASNYLQLQQSLSNINNFEIQVKIRTAEGTTFYRCILGSLETRELTLAQGSSSKLLLQLGNNGSSYAVELTGTTNLQPLTDYYIRVIYNNGTFSLLLSSDGINWNNEGSVTYTISTVTFIFGNGWNLGTYYWRGSIDIPNSYIKTGATKYKLQAVVGYTIVGSPTIVDGVVSGFSASNYIYITNAFTETINSFEIAIKATMPTTQATGYQDLVGQKTGNYNTPQIELDSQNRLYIMTSPDGSSWDNTDMVYMPIELGETYWFKFVYFNGTIESFMSTDGINFISKGTKTVSAVYWSGITAFGYDNGIHIFNGSIDINETYIKINNKLWFNGQQA